MHSGPQTSIGVTGASSSESRSTGEHLSSLAKLPGVCPASGCEPGVSVPSRGAVSSPRPQKSSRAGQGLGAGQERFPRGDGRGLVGAGFQGWALRFWGFLSLHLSVAQPLLRPPLPCPWDSAGRNRQWQGRESTGKEVSLREAGKCWRMGNNEGGRGSIRMGRGHPMGEPGDGEDHRGTGSGSVQLASGGGADRCLPQDGGSQWRIRVTVPLGHQRGTPTLPTETGLVGHSCDDG